MSQGKRIGIVSLLILFSAGLVFAQEKVAIQPDAKVGDLWQLKIDMKLNGQLKIRDGEKEQTLPLSATASHQFEERVFQIDNHGMPTSLARFYNEAKREVTLQGEKSSTSIRGDRKFQVALTKDDQTVTYSPSGPLTRTEAELTGEHLDVLAIYGLLPAKSVAIGGTWDASIPALQRMLDLDGIIQSQVTCKLDKVEQNHALITMEGTVTGITKGSQSKTEISASMTFSLESKRFTGVVWKLTAHREQGPMGPEATMNVAIDAKWNQLPQSQLTDGLISTVKANPDAGLLLLEYRDPDKRFAFLHDRSWGVVIQNKQQTVLRLLDKGELIAQLNITPLNSNGAGKHASLAELENLLKTAPGFEMEKVLDKAEPEAPAGHWIGKISAVGKASELPMQMSLYAIQGPSGEQILFHFSVEVEHIARFDSRDYSMIKTIGMSNIVTTGGK